MGGTSASYRLEGIISNLPYFRFWNKWCVCRNYSLGRLKIEMYYFLSKLFFPRQQIWINSHKCTDEDDEVLWSRMEERDSWTLFFPVPTSLWFTTRQNTADQGSPGRLRQQKAYDLLAGSWSVICRDEGTPRIPSPQPWQNIWTAAVHTRRKCLSFLSVIRPIKKMQTINLNKADFKVFVIEDSEKGPHTGEYRNEH